MPAPVIPAHLGFREGTPYSETFGDLYHSAAGGPAQARHVFLAGNGLPERWWGRECFVILEAGFGCGLNFLATWRAWRDDPGRCRRLHFVSIEKHPFALSDLKILLRNYPEFAGEAAQLLACWPMLVPGMHRVELEDGSVVLTLLFADIQQVRELQLAADAIYLDGFAPSKNPDMWSPAVLRAISRLAAPGATAATWSVASAVRFALETTGFTVEKRPGFGPKKEMLVARFVGSGRKFPFPSTRAATVIGAGLAGAALCERLCARGWQVRLVERRAEPAQEASGNHAGAFHPIVTPDDSVFARLTRSGFLASLSSWSRFSRLRWDRCGVLQLARDEKELASQQASLDALAPPPQYAALVSREEASSLAGVRVAAGGLWFPGAGWIQPRSLVQTLLESCGDRLERRFNEEVDAAMLESMAAQSIVVLANAHEGATLKPIAHARLRRVRGQVSYLSAQRFDAPRVVVLRGGFMLPPVEGLCVIGASYDLDDEDPAPRAASDAGNLERLKRILPDVSVNEGAFTGAGRVAFRSVAPDRLPIVGKLGENLHGVLAFGSRGLVWAALAAELLACALEGEPLPVEGRLANALDPGRFALRARRRAGSPGLRS